VQGLERPRSRSRERARERRERRRRRILRWSGAALLVAVAFFAGLAVGKALDDENGGGSQTIVQTLVPTTLTPQQTVTVTVSNP
jgi:hypothetical protein